jgi:hypothetical protein
MRKKATGKRKPAKQKYIGLGTPSTSSNINRLSSLGAAKWSMKIETLNKRKWI